ncbi:MAG: YHS domain-containing protein [Candidatus Omnitrophota bacterium]
MGRIVFVLVVILAAMGITANLYAEEMHEHKGSHSSEVIQEEEAVVQEGGVVNTVCPVMGLEVKSDTTFVVEHEGKKIGFCCPACVKKFKSDPEKYMAKLDQKT